MGSEEPEEIGWPTIVLTYWAYIITLFYAYIHNFFLFPWEPPTPTTPKGYAPLIHSFNMLYTRYLFGRTADCWNRPISSCPGSWIDVQERTGSLFFEDLRLTGRTLRCLNLGSYNYLGFAETEGKCATAVEENLEQWAAATGSTRLLSGSTSLHSLLESFVASFVGKEAAICFGMGYATNATTLHSLVGKGGLILSDSLNHASIVVGLRCSDAKVKVFKHNDPESLEKLLIEALVEGQPRTRRPWTKILIVVEGIYSMEGEILRLPEFIALKKKYKAFLYVDEAHSIGALGPHGRGICDHYGVSPDEVDILMGTFTKSFGAAGGYVAGSKELIDYLRATSYASLYDNPLPSPCVQQILTSMDIILNDEEGKIRLSRLRENSNYFRRRLKECNFVVIGDNDSPIVPIILCNPNKMSYFSRTALENGIGVVIAGYPATPLLYARARFCISASHSISDLEDAVKKMDVIARMGTITQFLQPLQAFLDLFSTKKSCEESN